MDILFAATGDGFFSTHWPLVLTIGLTFLGLQLVLCARFFHQIRRYEQILSDLNTDFEEGGSGRAHLDKQFRGFPWLKWVHANFSPGATTPGNYTRDEVLQELDTRVAGSSDYLLLQRMGVAAPLLGVLLTVLGFIWVNPPEDQELSIGQMLQQVYPLVAGVGTGAALAFINQGLLHLAGWKIEQLRMMARTWFDAVVWSSVGLDTQAATVKAIAAMEKMANSVSATADQQSQNASSLLESATAMQTAAKDFREMVGAMSDDVKGLPETLAELRKATSASTEALEELIPIGQRAVSGLDVSVAAFRSAVEREFIEAARKHHASIESLTDSFNAISATSRQGLEESGNQLNHSARVVTDAAQFLAQQLNDHAGAAGEVNRMQEEVRAAVSQLSMASNELQSTLHNQLGPSQHEILEAANSFRGSVQQLAMFIEQGVGPATEQLSKLNETLAGLEDTARSLKTISVAEADLTRLSHSLQQASTVADAMAQLPEQFREALAVLAVEQAEHRPSGSKLGNWFRSRPTADTAANNALNNLSDEG